MALIKCMECGGQVSSQAAACPHCGAKPQLPVRSKSRVPWVFLAIFLGGAWMVYSWPKPTPEEQAARAEQLAKDGQETGDTGSAYRAVKARVKDPESVKFDTVVYRETRFVCGHFNAKNSFGAYVGRTAFIYNAAQGLLTVHGEAPGFVEAWNKHCAL